MADFHTSTHRSRWMFKPQDLVAKREASNRRAVQTLHRCGTTRLDVDIDGSLSYPESQVHEGGNMKSIPDPLSVEEEQMIRIFYERKIQEVCGAFGFPHKIQATAIMYFKRFYLLWSVMEHDPKHIMLTCIYTSCKVEEFHVSAEELGRGIQQDHQVILNNEMIVLQSLGFDLIVYTPYRSIDGFIDDMEDFFKVNNVQAARYQDLRNAAIVETDKAMLTDAPLLFPPGQQALAILLGLNEEYKVMDFQRYSEGICLRGRHNDSYELNALLSDINTLVKEAKTPAAKDMRHIDRKLKYCWNPSLLDENKKKDKKKHKPKRTSSEILDAPAL